MNSFLKNPLKILDWFLSHEQSKSIDAIMRGRLIVSWMLIFVVLNPILFFLMDETSVSVFVLLPCYFFAELAGLYLIKRSFSPERVFAVIVLLSQVLVAFAIGLQNPVASDLFYSYFIFAAVIGLFVTDRMLSLSLQVSNVMVTGLSCLIFLKKLNGADWSIPNPTEGRVFLNSVANQVAFLVVIAVVLKIRKFAQNDIDQEIEWQQRTLRLGDLTSMTREMQVLLSEPVRSLNADFESLKSADDSSRMDVMETKLDELLLISQSFSWLYRAFSLEESSSIPSSSFLQQLRVLLSAKVKEGGWDFSINHPGQPFEIFGPLPSIMLFLFSIVVQILEGEASCAKKELSLELDRTEKFITWKLSWPNLEAKPKKSWFTSESPASSMRQELIGDLMWVCDAEIQEFEEPFVQGLLISGAWRPV